MPGDHARDVLGLGRQDLELEPRIALAHALDELEAGELSVEFEGQEPQALLEWALERFSPRIAISTAFQIDGSVLIDMAYAIDPSVKVFTVDTGRLPEETFELVEQVRERYPGIELEILAPEADHVSELTFASTETLSCSVE